ncbi:hypothetical protein MgSA37_02922 [Mucilaginibacter gotjawali]|uniref:Uncharacterized protein n=2 Tax=Mucilaginibacter gotjawali TaxID=1550579 RepID=A0A0X8X769_9SPHI|nr:hypothetical protein MgSA37_02922 [Mucilaginibacter gotjawali]
MLFFIGPFLVKHIAYYVINKPMLTINESYIFDHFNDRKYYWTDIEDIVATGPRDLLQIYLYEPKIYPRTITTPIEKFLQSIIKRKPKPNDSYFIDLSMVNFGWDKYDQFVDALNDYSIKAEGIENLN